MRVVAQVINILCISVGIHCIGMEQNDYKKFLPIGNKIDCKQYAVKQYGSKESKKLKKDQYVIYKENNEYYLGRINSLFPESNNEYMVATDDHNGVVSGSVLSRANLYFLKRKKNK